MKKITSWFVFLFVLTAVVAQAQVVNDTGESDTLQIVNQYKDSSRVTRILLVPFDPKMYTSDADKEIMLASKLNYSQLIARLRIAILTAIKNKISLYYDSRDLFEFNQNDSIDYIKMVYKSVGYYSENTGKFKSKKPPYELSGIHKGEVKVKENKGEKYTSTVITDKHILDILDEKTGSDLYIFISMMEIKNDLSDYAEVGTNNYKRTIHVHYTILNKNGKRISGAIAKKTLPAKINKLDEIINFAFADLADQIMMNTPQPKVIKIKSNTPLNKK